MFPEYIPSRNYNPNKFYNIDSHNLCENFFYNVTRKSDNKSFRLAYVEIEKLPEDGKSVLKSSMEAIENKQSFYKPDIVEAFLYEERYFLVFEIALCRFKNIIGG